MKENSNGNDTNVGSIENSIEEDIKLLQDETSSLVLFFKCKGSEKYKIALEHILSDYKRVLKENEELKEYIAAAPNLDEMTATKYRNIQQDAYIQGRAEEQQKAEQIIYENYILVQKVKDKIEKEIKYHGKNILDIENITMLKGKTAKEEAEIEFNKYAIVVLKKMLQELLEGRE